jgi:uncharacterized protein YuzE
MKLKVSYDAECDCAYIGFGEGGPSVAEESNDDNLIFDRSMKTNEVTGIEILNFTKWAQSIKALAKGERGE